MIKSESIKNISQALLKAQKNIENAVKDSSNPYFKSKYADLNSVMEACKKHLNDQGITVLQPVVSNEFGDLVETILLHESGEFIGSQMKLLQVKNMQEYGSAVTYARRYSLASIAFVGGEDDDGEAAMGRAKPANTGFTPGGYAERKNAGGFKPVTPPAETPKKEEWK